LKSLQTVYKIMICVGVAAILINFAIILEKASTHAMIPVYLKSGKLDDTAYSLRDSPVKMSGNYPLFIISLVALPIGIALFVMEKK